MTATAEEITEWLREPDYAAEFHLIEWINRRPTSLEAALATARADALEEAAKVADAHFLSDESPEDRTVERIAAAIRALKEKTS